MYSKIVCNKEHKKCVILKKTKEKLANATTKVLRVACVGGVFIVLVSFVACSGAKEISNNIESTKPKIETTLNQDKTTTKYEIQTTENVQQSTTGASEITIVQTTAPPPTTEEQKTTVKQTTQDTTQPTTSRPELKVITIEPTLGEYSKARLNKILDKVNAVLDTKDFPKLAKSFIRDGVEQIFNNYSAWKAAYKDFPTIEEYISKKIIPAIRNTNSIEMIDIKTQKAQNMLDSGDAFAATRGEDCDVYLIYNNPQTCSKEDHIGDVELLFHELAHCENKKVLFSFDNFLEDEELSSIYKEGGATMHMDLINPLSSNHSASAVVSNGDGNKTLEYGKDNGLGYMLEQYIYRNFVYLAGYDTVESVGHGKDISIIKDKIEEKYGYDLSEDIWSGLCNLYSNYVYRNEDDDTFKQAINLQNLILECVKKDIQSLDVSNKEQVSAFMDIYKNFKINLIPQVLKGGYTDISSKYFDMDSLDDLLISKIEKSGLFKLTSNKYRNHMIIKAMLIANCNSYSDTDFIYLPPNVSGTKYSFYEKNGNHLIITYTDERGQEVNLEVEFDDEKINTIDKSDGIEDIINQYRYEENDRDR